MRVNCNKFLFERSIANEINNTARKEINNKVAEQKVGILIT